MAAAPEPWLRGTLADLPPVPAQVLYTFQHVQEDLEKWTAGLDDAAAWRQPLPAVAPLGFHLKHIPGSVDRLLTYAEGAQLAPEQIAAMKNEMQPDLGLTELLARLRAGLQAAEPRVRRLAATPLEEPRAVGRQRLPTTVGGLLVHIAEHTQRHLGQAILTTKWIGE